MPRGLGLGQRLGIQHAQQGELLSITTRARPADPGASQGRTEAARAGR